MVTIEDNLFRILSNNRSSLIEIAKLFKATDEEINHPSFGAYVRDCITQLKTAQLIVEHFQKRQQKNLSVETYNTNPFENRPNPLLVTLPEKITS